MALSRSPRPRSSTEGRGRSFLELDETERLVWADEHLDAGDPRAEAVTLDEALPGLSGDERERARARLDELTRAHREAWAGDLAPFLDLARSSFRHGLLDTAVVSWRTPARALRAALAAPEWRSVRRVFFEWAAPGLDAARRRSPEAVTQLQLLERLPALRGVGGLLPNVFSELAPRETLTELHLRTEGAPPPRLLEHVARHRGLRRLGFACPAWAPPQLPAPMWKPFTPPGLELLTLECQGRGAGWLRLAKGLGCPSLAVQTPELGNAWLRTQRLEAGLALALWFPDAGYLAEGCISALEDLVVTDVARVEVWLPGALVTEHALRLEQALARFARAERALLTGRLPRHPLFVDPA
ncbi:MAG: hypothetical protein ACOZQL_19200 [Myxococcota bacterium]